MLTCREARVDKHTHLEIFLQNRSDRIIYRDIRKFGRWLLLAGGPAEYLAKHRLGPDALALDSARFIATLLQKKGPAKAVLLDQTIVAGIGNIYADEALWRSRLHYDQPANTISKMKAKELLSAVTEILQKAVAEGGTSFDEQYKNVNGESGYFAVSLNAYGMTGLPCKRCGTAIKRENWMNRGSHFCPKCQRLKH